MTRGKNIRVAVFGLVLAAAATPAGAQTPRPGDQDASADERSEPVTGPWDAGVSAERRRAARELMLEGNRLIKVPLFAQAAAKYRKALDLWAHPAIQYNLGVAQLNLVQPIEAYKSFREALRHGPGPLGQEKFEQGKEYLAILESRLARVSVSCDVAGAEVTVDGEPLFVGPGEGEAIVNPGRHQLVAGKRGYLTETRQLVLSPGQRLAVAMELTTLEHARESSRRWAAWKPWAVAGAGVAVGLAGAVVHWRSATNFADFDARFGELPCGRVAEPVAAGCTSGQVPPEAARTLDRARLQQRVAVGAYVAGAVVLATGLALVTLNRPRVEDATLEPLLSPSTVGVGAWLHF